MVPVEMHQNRLLLAAVSLGFSRKKRDRSIFKKGPRERAKVASLRTTPQQPHRPTHQRASAASPEPEPEPDHLGDRVHKPPKDTEPPGSSCQPDPVKERGRPNLPLYTPAFASPSQLTGTTTTWASGPLPALSLSASCLLGFLD